MLTKSDLFLKRSLASGYCCTFVSVVYSVNRNWVPSLADHLSRTLYLKYNSEFRLPRSLSLTRRMLKGVGVAEVFFPVAPFMKFPCCRPPKENPRRSILNPKDILPLNR